MEGREQKPYLRPYATPAARMFLSALVFRSGAGAENASGAMFWYVVSPLGFEPKTP